ncbi:type VI secretion system (T6SS) effector Hcp [Ulvibacter sp. MAR_2010_11]|uniref:type VI secretion system tube protein Hcp n=1 Tax=Ulvibacter sp. MAR_2010_11 TaxID=1250229 RepID=UPI000C2B7AB5|nr:type VI secretion system tube protein Hcp [Ulvibacter sp. MAR_2010_11]PKA82015.1 type VI secretion system (T6SS) effector Hcp [Ulvibacter sp. MAR_2010_11]
MKTTIITIALVAISTISCQLAAQEVAAKSVGYDLQKNIKCRVIPTETGFSVAFEYDTKATQEDKVAQASGKKGYDYYKAKSEFTVNLSDNTVTEVVSPRDAASGLPSGKRQHKPLTITKEMDKSTPVIYNKVSSAGATTDGVATTNKGLGTGKVNMQDMSFTKRCADLTTVYPVVDGVSIIPVDDCPNGRGKIIWTWADGTLESSDDWTTNKRAQPTHTIEFIMDIQDGVCTAMAINEKGLPGEKPKKTKPKN